MQASPPRAGCVSTLPDGRTWLVTSVSVHADLWCVTGHPPDADPVSDAFGLVDVADEIALFDATDFEVGVPTA